MNFAASTIEKFVPRTANRPGKLSSYFFGLFGPDGALPLHLTEYALNRIKYNKDHTFARFVDIFHHRLACYFYRAWAASRPTVNYDRPELDRFSDYIGAFAGVGMASLKNRDAMPDLARYFYSGHMVNQTRHADGLAQLIEGFFEVPVKIEQFIPEWLELPADSRLCLGISGGGVLGESATIGERVFHCQHKFRIELGPMDLDAYERLTPNGDDLKKLVAFVSNYVGEELSYELQLVLKKEQVPTAKIGAFGALGWTTWLGERKSDLDADDMRVDPCAVLSRARASGAPRFEFEKDQGIALTV